MQKTIHDNPKFLCLQQVFAPWVASIVCTHATNNILNIVLTRHTKEKGIFIWLIKIMLGCFLLVPILLPISLTISAKSAMSVLFCFMTDNLLLNIQEVIRYPSC